MRHKLLACALLLAVTQQARAQDPDKQSFEMIEHGRYMAAAADCSACHTAPGGKPYAGGGALETPFGVLLSPNITPDQQTGIGGWTDEEFVQAVQNGIGHDGIHLYPAMPYVYYAKLTRADVLAIRAYLDTLQPVHNRVITNQLPFPFNQRESMAAWNALYFRPGQFKPDPAQSPEWNRGAYLVEGAGHCGLCHTPKNAMGADESGRFMQGTVLESWYAPNLTSSARLGLGDWSIDDIMLYLKTGSNRFGIASGPMADAVNHSTSHLSNADLRAVAVYLKSLPPSDDQTPSPISARDPLMQQGQTIYATQCSACHTPQGHGIVGLFPHLSESASVQQDQATSLIRVVLEGSRAVATAAHPTGPAMPSFAWKLSDADIAAVVTYIRNAWGNAASRVSPGDVGNLRRVLHREAQQAP
jgi:mono/diheme cytochrome c family protein